MNNKIASGKTIPKTLTQISALRLGQMPFLMLTK